MTTAAIAPQPLKGVRIVDLTWMLASAGTTVLLRQAWAPRLFESNGPGISISPAANW